MFIEWVYAEDKFFEKQIYRCVCVCVYMCGVCTVSWILLFLKNQIKRNLFTEILNNVSS